ncbi:hypothetical protein HY640_01545 [Candidatus Woesearchaeota archaeon]|nr:hypothetical protein [Candidatus Woesearchaeota archaeon]
MRLLFFLFAAALLASSADALSIGVSPGRVDFNDVLKGGYAEKTLTVSTNSESPLVASVELGGEVSEWLSLEPNQTRFVLSVSSPYRVKVIVRPPKDARNDSYSGSVTFNTEGLGNLTTRIGGIIRTGVTSVLELRTTGREIVACSAGNIQVSDTEHSLPLLVTAVVQNTGNVRLRPSLRVSVFDQSMKSRVLQRTAVGEEVLPTSERVVSANFPNQLGVGQYWAEVVLDECGVVKTGTFDVGERGSVSDKGELSGIRNPGWVSVNETVPIRAAFRNSGSRAVSAYFRGEVRLDGRFISQLQSEELTVPSGSDVELVSYFVPATQGRYVVSGQVVYNRKVTFEQSSIFTVVQRAEAESPSFFVSVLPLVVYLAVTVSVVVLLRAVLRKRGRR